MFVRDWHVKLGVVAASRAHVIPQGADPPEAQRCTWPADPTVGFIGSLEDRKGILTLLRAAEGADWRLIVAGDGSRRGLVEEACAQNSNISFVGHVSGREKDQFFESIEVLAVPSEWEENAPLTVVEAAVRGIPSVVSERGGLPESPEALIARAGDPVHLRSVLSRALQQRRLLSDRLKERQEELLFSNHAQRVETVLRTAVCNPVSKKHGRIHS